MTAITELKRDITIVRALLVFMGLLVAAMMFISGQYFRAFIDGSEVGDFIGALALFAASLYGADAFVGGCVRLAMMRQHLLLRDVEEYVRTGPHPRVERIVVGVDTASAVDGIQRLKDAAWCERDRWSHQGYIATDPHDRRWVVASPFPDEDGLVYGYLLDGPPIPGPVSAATLTWTGERHTSGGD